MDYVQSSLQRFMLVLCEVLVVAYAGEYLPLTVSGFRSPEPTHSVEPGSSPGPFADGECKYQIRCKYTKINGIPPRRVSLQLLFSVVIYFLLEEANRTKSNINFVRNNRRSG